MTLRVWKLPLEHSRRGSQSEMHSMFAGAAGTAPGGQFDGLDAAAIASTSNVALPVAFVPGGTSIPGRTAASSEGSNQYCKYVLTGHQASVRAIAGEGRIVVSGSYDHSVRVWDVVTGTQLHYLTGHKEKVYSVGYCAKIDRAVSGSMDATVRVWCTRTGTAMFTLEGHSSLVGLLEISPKFLVSAAADSTLRIWNPMTGECLATLSGHQAAITSFHHDPNLNRIVSGAEGGVKMWELKSTTAATAPRDIADGSSAAVATDSAPAEPAVPRTSRTAPAPPARALANLPKHGRHVRDLVTGAFGVWRVQMDRRRLVTALQRDEHQTWFEVLDFGDAEDREEDDWVAAATAAEPEAGSGGGLAGAGAGDVAEVDAGSSGGGGVGGEDDIEDDEEEDFEMH
ncbi:SCF ubiquitin ligase complex subunit cdc4 [Cladochytrium tenue]|nr:SCF ubiquitin ligase complex subunit cdc4 [Cladochytrium tenue]